MANSNRVSHSFLAKFLALLILVFVVLIAKKISHLETNTEIIEKRLTEIDPRTPATHPTSIKLSSNLSQIEYCENFQECSNEDHQLSQDELYEVEKKCFPTLLKDYSTWFTINILLICLIGGVGNTITLLSVPYVYYRYPAEFQLQWNSVTMLMLHLSMVDLIYVCLCLPSFLLIYNTGYFPYPHWMCWLTAAVRNLTAYADFLTLACIALLRMRGICKNQNRQQRSGSDSSCFVVVGYISCIWSLSFLIISPILFELVIFKIDFGAFGYDPVLAMCNTVSCPNYGISPSGMIATVGFFGPFFAINISYIIIAMLYIEADRQSNLQRDQQQVDVVQLTRTLILLSGSYMLFYGPLLPLEWSDTWGIHKETKIMLYTLGYNWYWWAYANNFLVYMLTSQAFRKIFKIFLRDVWLGLKACFKTKAPVQDSPEAAKSDPSRQVAAVVQNRPDLQRAYTIDNSALPPSFKENSDRPADTTRMYRSFSLYCQPKDIRLAEGCVKSPTILINRGESGTENQPNTVELQALSALVLLHENPRILTLENYQLSSSNDEKLDARTEPSNETRQNKDEAKVEGNESTHEEGIMSWIQQKLFFRRRSEQPNRSQ